MAKLHTQWIMQIQKRCLQLYMPFVSSNDMNNKEVNKEITNWRGSHLSLFSYGCKSTLGLVPWTLILYLSLIVSIKQHQMIWIIIGRWIKIMQICDALPS